MRVYRLCRHALTELAHFHTRAQARTALFEFIEGFYNRQRLHSSLGYYNPADYEAAHANPHGLSFVHAD